MAIYEERVRFRDRVADPYRRVMIFEFVPPELSVNPTHVERSAAALVKSLEGFRDVDAVYIPEVVGEENRVLQRNRTEARKFAATVRSYNPDTELIISHPFPYTPIDKTDAWLEQTGREYRIGNVIVVGARHMTAEMPGYTVVEATKRICSLNEQGRTKIFPGAIAIDTRGLEKGDEMEEARRMVEKTKAGAQFFVTQIFYTHTRMINLLQRYDDECKAAGVTPRRVFLGVSPIPNQGTLNVIDDLRETKLEETERDIYTTIFYGGGPKKRDTGKGNRSIQEIEISLRRIFDYCYGNLSVPLGICVEHVTEVNFRHSFELLHSLPELWKKYLPD